MKFCWTAFIALILAELVASYPSGHPDNGCESMVPAHGARPSSDEPPYTVTMSVKCYEPGKQINVKIRGDALKGFFIRSMKVGDDLSNAGVGKFKIRGGNAQLRCNEAGATHTNNNTKNMVMLKWMAPPTKTGPVVFLATVVKELSLFWVEIMSTELEECSDGPEPTTTVPNPTPATKTIPPKPTTTTPKLTPASEQTRPKPTTTTPKPTPTTKPIRPKPTITTPKPTPGTKPITPKPATTTPIPTVATKPITPKPKRRTRSTSRPVKPKTTPISTTSKPPSMITKPTSRPVKPKTTSKPARPRSTPSPKRPCLDKLSREKPEKVKINKIPRNINSCRRLKGRRSGLCSKDALRRKCCKSCMAHTCVNSLTWKLERGHKCRHCTCAEIKKMGLMRDCCSRKNRWRGIGHNGKNYSCRQMCCKSCSKIQKPKINWLNCNN